MLKPWNTSTYRANNILNISHNYSTYTTSPSNISSSSILFISLLFCPLLSCCFAVSEYHFSIWERSAFKTGLLAIFSSFGLLARSLCSCIPISLTRTNHLLLRWYGILYIGVKFKGGVWSVTLCFCTYLQHPCCSTIFSPCLCTTPPSSPPFLKLILPLIINPTII